MKLEEVPSGVQMFAGAGARRRAGGEGNGREVLRVNTWRNK